MAIVYRNTGAWGAGKGSRLTSLEGDGNFWDHEQRIAEMESNPPTAVGIYAIDVTGNQMTIVLSDSTELGPFTLPTSTWSFKGEWLPATIYFVGDIITHEGAIYLVLVNHTSDASFSSMAESVEGFWYNLILEAPGQPYDIGMYAGDTLPDDGSILLQHIAARDFVISVEFGQSVAFLNTAVEYDLELPIYQNETQIGTLLFEVDVDTHSPAGQYGTFLPLSPTEEFQFSRFDRLIVYAPTTPYPTPAGLAVTFTARTGTI